MNDQDPVLAKRSHSFGDPLAGGGEAGALMRAFPWRSTSVGPPEQWPQGLKTAIRIMLTSRQPIWVGWGKELLFFYNDAYQSIIGNKHPWALGRPTSVVWSEIRDEIEPLLATAMGGVEGTYVEEQLLIMERNGYPEETYYTFSYSPVPDDSGRPGGVICANTDDTQRVIGERQLTSLRQLGAATAAARTREDSFSLSASTLENNGRDLPFVAIYVRNASEKEWRLAASRKLTPTVAAELFADASRASLQLDEAHANGKILTARMAPLMDRAAIPRGDWERPPESIALVPIPSAGETGAAAVLVVGLNPFRLFDEDYRSFLQLAASQISAAIANADAYEQEKLRADQLIELDRVKTAFFSNVSHEFRTPLTLMMGPLEESLAHSPGLAPEDRERVELAHRNGMRLLKLVNSLLDFSRIESGRSQAHRETVDLSALTADLASNFRSTIEKAGLVLTVDCPASALFARVDHDMWEKIVLNLLSNAFKFTFEGSIGVALKQNANEATLVVRDTGVGIPHAELPRLFERFHRVEATKGRSFEGSGIGLALVQELVRLHGGSIRVESQEGAGSTFTVTIPADGGNAELSKIGDGPTGATPLAQRAMAFVEEARRWLPSEAGVSVADALDAFDPTPTSTEHASDLRSHVLIVDDNADMRLYLQRLLGGRHECETAADGRAALDAVRKRRPDLILTDVMMPGLDGFGLLSAIRSDPALRDLPVIVLSARAGEDASLEGLSAGADDYLAKPFSARELIARVDGALAMARVRREMGEALREEARSLEILNRVGADVAAELDLDRAVQTVVDAATQLTGAAFGSFFYNVTDERGESYTLYTISGVPREAFSQFPMPRNTALFAPTFAGERIVRSNDILKDERYGKNEPHHGMPKGHLPVRSYLAAPVVSRSGEVLGGLFFGHPKPGVFDQRAERLLQGIAGQAAIAIDNASLYKAAQAEISQRKLTEAALRESEEMQLRLNENLEAKVVERTAELEIANTNLRAEAEQRERVEQVLLQAQKMDAIGKLTGGVAHDFNNLLQVIGGNLQLLAKDVAGRERAEERLRNAIAGVARGAKLASQLLAFGRRQPLAPKVINLGRFIRGLDDLLRRALGDGVEIETIISGGLWNSLVDPSQVENALLNLAINARDAMEGQGKLTIEAGNAMLDDAYAVRHVDVKPGQYVMLAVTDTGCGMTPEIMEHVFEPFFTTKPEGRGTGLGLSMVYGFVKQSDGHLKIYSEPGHGTTIRLYLPRVREAEDVATEIDAGPVVGGAETILVVEDDEDVRATVIELLSELGYSVLKARDAQSALAIVESGVPIDLLFTDVVMPGPLRSPELARKARERLPDVGILFTSGYTDNTIVHHGRLDEGIELLSKPYAREALARKVRHVLRNQQQRSLTPPAMAEAVSARRAASPLTWPGLRVLLVEDDPLIRVATADMLEECGCVVASYGLGAQALAALKVDEFKLVIVDIGLPDMSGVDVGLAALRGKGGPRLIFASGANELPAQQKELASATLLRKPYDFNAVRDALRRALSSA